MLYSVNWHVAWVTSKGLLGFTHPDGELGRGGLNVGQSPTELRMRRIRRIALAICGVGQEQDTALVQRKTMCCRSVGSGQAFRSNLLKACEQGAGSETGCSRFEEDMLKLCT